MLGGLLLVAMFWAFPSQTDWRFPGRTWRSVPPSMRPLFRRGQGEVNRVAAAAQLWGWTIVFTGLIHLAGQFSGLVGWITLALNGVAMLGVLLCGVRR